MSLIRQILLSLVVMAAAVAAWIAFVPSAVPVLERAGVFDLLGMEPPAPPEEESEGGWGQGPSLVVVTEVVMQRQNSDLRAIGDGRALRSVTLRSEVSGRIRSVNISSGDFVEEGEIVIELEDDAEQIAMSRAQLLMANAEREYERVNTLTQAGAVTAVRVQEAELALQDAELALRQAESDLGQRQIHAPISGWVGIVDLEHGERITAEDSLAVLTDRSRILVDFRLPERVVDLVEPGQPFWAEPLAHRNRRLEGQIIAIDNVVDRASRTLRVRGALDNSDDSLRAGMAFSVAMSFEGTPVPAVPPLAVQWSASGAFVWVVREGRSQRVPVTILQRNEQTVLVDAELEAGMMVIVEGVQTLRPNGEVEISSQVMAQPEVPAVQPAKL